jgi:hypothetical protein
MSAYPLSNVANPYAPLEESQRYQIIQPTDPWTNQYAISIVRDSVAYMEQHLQQTGNLTRWTDADKLLVGYRPQKKWENSQKLRARIPVFLLFSQLESLLPNVLQALFPLYENVDVAPRPGSTLEGAHEAFELVMAQLDSLGESGITRFYTIARQCFDEAFLYGNGIIEITWLFKVLKRIVCHVDWKPPMQPIYDMLTGQMLNVPVGPPQRQVTEMQQQFTLNQPNIENVHIRDFIIDPDCPTPSVQDARMCARRSFPTVGELTQYRGQPFFDIPDDKTLIELSMQNPVTAADSSKRQAASYFGSGYGTNYSNDNTTDPYQRRIELYRWFSKERCVWMLNRQWAAYNRYNEYNFLPFLDAFYVPFPRRFHGISLADVVEGNQNLIASLKEARLDELSLALNAPFVRQSGTMIGNPGSLAMSPAKMVDVQGKPNEVLMRLDVQSQAQSAFMEANDAERQTAKDTGLSDLSVMGVPQAGGNSANRTATGVDRQAQAATTRIEFLVENSQASFIEPLCTIMHQFNMRFLPRDQLMPILTVNGQQKYIDPVKVLNAMPRFTVRAAARLRQRNQLMQVLPWFVQTMLNPELLQLMATQYKMKLKVPNLMTLITDTLNTPRIELWEPMTPEEIQQQQAPPPEAQLEMQKQRERLQAQGEIQQDKGDTALLQAIASRLLTPRAAHDFLGFSDTEHMQADAQRRRANGGAQQ